MKKKITALLGVAVLCCALAAGCGSSAESSEVSSAAEQSQASEPEAASESVVLQSEPDQESSVIVESEPAEQVPDEAESSIASEAESEAGDAVLEDGVYTAEFDTDSSMFHVNEANDGKGILTVENGKMTIHVSLVSKNILNLFYGLAEDAQKEGAVLLEPTTDTVDYGDGTTDEVYGFDIPVPALDEEFDVAIIGKKGVWYDHKVSVSNPEKTE